MISWPEDGAIGEEGEAVSGAVGIHSANALFMNRMAFALSGSGKYT